MLKRALMFASLVYLGLPDASADAPPSKDTVEAWWKSKSAEEMKIEGNLVEVRLRNKEAAYLVSAGFYGRGRNDISHIVMVRPTLKEVREVAEPVGSDIEVHDLNHDGISEVVASWVGSGQGTTAGTKSIVQFDGWAPIVLYQGEFFEGCGFIGMDYRCSSTSVTWKFVDLDNDGNSDLIEEIATTPDSPANKPAATSKEVRRLLFKGNQFTEYSGPTRATKK